MLLPLTDQELAEVRIPSHLSAELDRYFSALKSKTLEGAVHRAASRATSDGGGIVQKEDLTESARDALNDSLSKMAAIFNDPEPHHVRIAS